MSSYKSINYLSIDTQDFREVMDSQSHTLSNDSFGMVMHGSPNHTSFLHPGQIYHLVEPRIILVAKGYGRVNINLESYDICQGTAVLATADIIMEPSMWSPDIEIIGIIFKEDIPVHETIVQPCSPAEFARLLRMAYIVWDLANQLPFRQQAVLQMVGAIASNIQYLKEATASTERSIAPTRSQKLFQQFKTLVNQHCDSERNIPFYADLLFVSPHHLSAVISKASGHSVMYWVNRAVILKAKVLLKTSGLMSYEIAERLHFPSSSAFSSFFKREAGMTPKEYVSLSVPRKKP